MAVADRVERAKWALEYFRLEEAERITDAVQTHQIVGVLGEAEVGKTTTVHQALGPSIASTAILELDLDSAASESHIAWQLARQITQALLGSAEFSTLKAGVLVPASIEAQRVELGYLLGLDGLDEALSDWPSGRYELPRALDALERMVRQSEAILWIDHLETPGLTPRHPLDLERLLWGLREMAQNLPALSLVLSGRIGAEATVLGREAAFHQQGRWLSLDNPPAEIWRGVARSLDASQPVATELAERTGGHPETMILALLELSAREPGGEADEVLRYLSSIAGGLSGRAMQHARTLHRLGGQVLQQVANGSRPYGKAQRGASPQQEITKVLSRLRQAGLIRRDDDGWSVVNPMIGMALRGKPGRTRAPDLDEEDDAERAS